MRRGLFLSIVAATLLASGVSYGQSPYPTRQVRIVVPYPAGGPTDLIARLIAQKLGERLGQSFFVENVAGASGAVGAGQVAHAAPDGYTLLVSTNDFAVASVTNTNLPYDPVKNFSPVSLIATSPQVVAVNPSVPAKTMKELVDLIKAAPEKYNYAAIGIGFGQLTSERLFKLALKLDGLVRVPFNGAAPAVNATLAFPQIPTLRESGIPDQEADLINGMVAPAGTPPEIITLLQKQIAEIVQLPDFKATLDKLSFQPVGSTSAQFADQIKNDIVVWSKVMKDANIPVN
jgi:tripartite-type tricarboxylate transporter receptor subunit TctC